MGLGVHALCPTFADEKKIGRMGKTVRAIRVLQPLAFIGENSMTLLVTHALVYYPVMYFSTLTPWQSVGVIFAGYVLLLTPLLLLKRRKNVSRT